MCFSSSLTVRGNAHRHVTAQISIRPPAHYIEQGAAAAFAHMTLLISCVPIETRNERGATPMKSLLIIYHSQSGTSAQLARAAWRGAQRESDMSVSVQRAWDASTLHLSQADGVLLVMAENSGALSGGMKDFLDRTFYPAIARELVLPYALLISAGNDGRGAQRQAQRILSGYPFPAAAEPLILRGEWCPAHQEASAELGQAFAAGLSMGIF